MAESDSGPKPTAAALLGDWRAAGRDLVAARDTASVADLAASAAEVARVAAVETGESAKLSSEAAQRAVKSATRTAEAAEITSRAANSEMADSRASLQGASDAEVAAGEAYHSAERDGFPKG